MQSSTKVQKRGDKYLWKSEDKARAVAAYSATGSFSKASTLIGIPEMTIRYWAKQEWWLEEMLRADKADGNELKATFTRIAKRASELLEDRLENGDDVVTKDGTVVKKNIAGRDLAIISAVAADKRKQELDQPDRVTIQSSTERLAQLMEEFMKFAKAKQIKGEILDVQEIPDLTQKPV